LSTSHKECVVFIMTISVLCVSVFASWTFTALGHFKKHNCFDQNFSIHTYTLTKQRFYS